ncbi:hypothetical protein ACQP00_20350 [Dactylosporangium sp. CS-047395]|uniref:hypothetical protein n=1 Tax=Dactylosporangium sp. CS-047395 TaxID=3239936 RepID=UPI003D8B12A1
MARQTSGQIRTQVRRQRQPLERNPSPGSATRLSDRNPSMKQQSPHRDVAANNSSSNDVLVDALDDAASDGGCDTLLPLSQPTSAPSSSLGVSELDPAANTSRRRLQGEEILAFVNNGQLSGNPSIKAVIAPRGGSTGGCRT